MRCALRATTRKWRWPSPTSATCSVPSSSTSACRAEGIKADHRRRPVDRACSRQRRQACGAPAAAGVQRCRATATSVRPVVARVDDQRATRAGVDQMGVARRVRRRAHRVVGRRRRRGGCCAAGGRSRARRRLGAATGVAVPWALSTSSCSARACRPTRRTCAPRWRSRRELEAAGGGHAPGAVCRRPTSLTPTRRGVRRRRRDAGQPAAHQAVLARAVFQDPGADARRCSPTCRRRWPTASGIAQRCNLQLDARRGAAA